MIGRVIEAYAKRFGYGVVREFTGHGIGTSFHSGLVIPHYDDPRFDDEIRPGMTFTIEPMLNLGTHEWVMWDDGWTVVTADGPPQRPVRAHPPGDQRRRRDPDPAVAFPSPPGRLADVFRRRPVPWTDHPATYAADPRFDGSLLIFVQCTNLQIETR